MRATLPGCCALAATGHAGALPRTVANCRRVITVIWRPWPHRSSIDRTISQEVVAVPLTNAKGLAILVAPRRAPGGDAATQNFGRFWTGGWSAMGQKQPTCLAPACLLSPAADILQGKIIIPTPPAARARRRAPGRHALRPLRALPLVKGTDTLGFLKRGSVASGDLLGSARG